MANDDTIVVIHDCGDDMCPRFGQQIHKDVTFVLVTEADGQRPEVLTSTDVDAAAVLLGSAVALLPTMERSKYDVYGEDGELEVEVDLDDETNGKPN